MLPWFCSQDPHGAQPDWSGIYQVLTRHPVTESEPRTIRVFYAEERASLGDKLLVSYNHVPIDDGDYKECVLCGGRQAAQIDAASQDSMHTLVPGVVSSAAVFRSQPASLSFALTVSQSCLTATSVDCMAAMGSLSPLCLPVRLVC